MKTILFTILLSLFTSLGWAAVVCDNETTASGDPPADPQTLVATPSATGGVWIIAVAIRETDGDNGVVNTVTSSAGGTFTLYGANAEIGGEDILSYIFYSIDYVGGSQTISVDYVTSTPLQGFIAQYVCTGVRLPNPWLGVATTGNTNGGTSVSLSVPCKVGGLAVDAIAVASLGAGLSPTIGADQASMYAVALNTNNFDVAGSTEVGAATNTMSWSSADNNIWGSVGGCLVPPSAAGTPIFLQ